MSSSFAITIPFFLLAPWDKIAPIEINIYFLLNKQSYFAKKKSFLFKIQMNFPNLGDKVHKYNRIVFLDSKYG